VIIIVDFFKNTATLIIGQNKNFNRKKKTKMSRDTTTGKKFEESISCYCEKSGYKVERQKNLGKKPFSKTRWMADLVVSNKEGKRVLVSLKWQHSNGTAEEKIAYEILNLKYAAEEMGFHKVLLILGGTDRDKDGKGWTLRESLIKGDNKLFSSIADSIEINYPEYLYYLIDNKCLFE
jgi:hypothetical protein